MVVFERAIIKKFWPADDKGDDDEIIRQVVVQIEGELVNSLQVGELYNSMVRGLVSATLMDNLSGEEYALPAVTIKPFNIKQKKIKIGKGEDADIVKSEYAAMTLISKLNDNEGGTVLGDLYRFFNIELQLRVEDFQMAPATPTQSSDSEDSES
jgi:hypothetical protein